MLFVATIMNRGENILNDSQNNCSTKRTPMKSMLQRNV